MPLLKFQKLRDNEFKDVFTQEITHTDADLIKDYIRFNKPVSGFYRYVLNDGINTFTFHTCISFLLDYIKDTQK